MAKKSARGDTGGSSTRRRRNTGSTAVLPLPVLADTLRVTIDNFIAAGYTLLGGNVRGGFALQVLGLYQCDTCRSFVPESMLHSGGCTLCTPPASTGGNGDVHAAA